MKNGEMDCKFCGKANVEKKCNLFGAPDPGGFTLGYKGQMSCDACYKKLIDKNFKEVSYVE